MSITFGVFNKYFFEPSGITEDVNDLKDGAKSFGNWVVESEAGQLASWSGDKIGQGASWAGDKIGQGASWVGDTSVGQGVKKAGKWVAESTAGNVAGFVGETIYSTATMGFETAKKLHIVDGMDAMIGENAEKLFTAGMGSLAFGAFGPLMKKSWDDFTKELKEKDLDIKVTSYDENNGYIIGPYASLDDNTKIPRIYGMPFSYTKTSDPGGRTYEKTFLSDMPILTLIPGFPKYSGNLDQYIGKKDLDTESVIDLLKSNGINDETWQDRRLYTFEANWEEYYQYVSTIVESVKIKMGLSDEIVDISSMVNESGKNLSLSYYVDGLTGGGMSESFSTSYASSSIEQKMRTHLNDDMSSQLKELNYLAGTGATGALQTRQFGMAMSGRGQALASLTNSYAGKDAMLGPLSIGSSKNKYLNMAQRSAAGAINFAKDPFASNMMKGIMDSQRGLELIYPKVWENSGYSRSINLNFKFFSPYGDPMSIFKNVYVPMFTLLGLVMPRQDGENGYMSPLICRADIPGLFTMDMAYIESLSITKGGGENLWTKDNYPRQIDVSITLADIYPGMMMTKHMSYFHNNPSFMTFLDGYAGLVTKDVLNEGSDKKDLFNYFSELNNKMNGNIGDKQTNSKRHENTKEYYDFSGKGTNGLMGAGFEKIFGKLK